MCSFDPSLVSYAELVEFNFRMHLPTEVDRQGPDRGTQYRTAIFTTDASQVEIANTIKAEVQVAHYPNEKIATTVSLLPLLSYSGATRAHATEGASQAGRCAAQMSEADVGFVLM